VHRPEDAQPAPAPAPDAAPAAAAPPTPAEIAAAARVLAAIAADSTLLTAVDEETRRTLRRHAGEVAGPDLKARKRFQRELLRKKQQAKREADVALRRETGIRRLREEPVYRPPFPLLPPRGTDASGWWPVLHGSVEA